jgi:hypothetical protein
MPTAIKLSAVIPCCGGDPSRWVSAFAGMTQFSKKAWCFWRRKDGHGHEKSVNYATTAIYYYSNKKNLKK